MLSFELNFAVLLGLCTPIVALGLSAFFAFGAFSEDESSSLPTNSRLSGDFGGKIFDLLFDLELGSGTGVLFAADIVWWATFVSCDWEVGAASIRITFLPRAVRLFPRR